MILNRRTNPLESKNGVKGHLIIREISKETGDILSEFSEEQMIVDDGLRSIWRKMVMETTDPDMDGLRLKTIFLGDDFGGSPFTIFNPQPAGETFTASNQSVVYQVPESDIVITYPTMLSVRFSTILDGTDILNTNFPTEVDMRYNSATLRFVNNSVFAYKRFPIRSLSRLVNVQILWTLSFLREED